MTKDEAIATAIATLENIKQFGIDKWMFDKEEIEAFDMAIKALSAMTDGDLISRQDAIRWVKTECNPYGKPTLDFESGKRVIEHLEQMQSAEPKTDEEDELKFYYVESIDDYWIGARLDNFYYADWHDGLGFVWSHSKYLPWGEHIVDENTLWKEHTYPSEPIEIPFTEWIVGFVKKYFAEPKTPCKTCGYYNLECPKNCEYGRPSADLISRADAIKAFSVYNGKRIPEVDCDNFPIEIPIKQVKDTIRSLPSADRPSGEWINGQTINGVDYKRCNQCFAEIDDSFFGESSFDVNFCPNCGAKMGDEEDV